MIICLPFAGAGNAPYVTICDESIAGQYVRVVDVTLVSGGCPDAARCAVEGIAVIAGIPFVFL